MQTIQKQLYLIYVKRFDGSLGRSCEGHSLTLSLIQKRHNHKDKMQMTKWIKMVSARWKNKPCHAFCFEGHQTQALSCFHSWAERDVIDSDSNLSLLCCWYFIHFPNCISTFICSPYIITHLTRHGFISTILLSHSVWICVFDLRVLLLSHYTYSYSVWHFDIDISNEI